MAKKDVDVTPEADKYGAEHAKCTSKDDAYARADELGYPVLIDGVLHAKKAAALAAIDAAMAVAGAVVIVARPGKK